MVRKLGKKESIEDKEVNAAIKNFKASQEVEDFYQYIHDNKLRSEAHTLIKTVLNSMQPKRKRKGKLLQ